jgi:hypothetical protein
MKTHGACNSHAPKKALVAALMSVLFVSGAPRVSAHHSFAAEFDASKPIKVTGTVTRVEWGNPHIWFHIDVKDAAGKLSSWGLEMGSPNQLLRAGWKRTSLQVGDVVTAEGFAHRTRPNVGNARVVTLAATGRRLLDPAGGKPNLTAHTPRAGNGKPDLSGVWKPAKDPTSVAGGIEGLQTPRYMIDITSDLKPGEVPFTPWAAAIYKERNANLRRGNPLIRCLPAGVPRLDAYSHPYKIVQTPDLIVILYESLTMFRQIHLDGRALPEDPQPAWMGYSIGRWEGDVLVVESAGFNDLTWLDGAGHPHSEQMHLTERFKRRDVGHLDVEVLINDPKAYTKPLKYSQPQELLPDTELLEYICAENAKEVGP